MPDTFVHVALPGRVVLAPGALDRVPAEIDLLSHGGVLLIVDSAARDAGDRLAKALGDRVRGRLDDVRQHVPEDLAESTRSFVAQIGANVLVSIGGGSATGLAKAVALTTGLPILAVPTTYAGSEMTPVWGITAGGEKRTGTDPVVLPRTVVYDPELSRGLPIEITAASIGNALAHCVEAVWTPRADPITEVTAVEGARALAEGLRHVLNDLADLVARSNLLYGACLAGSALASAGTGLHHKVCHALGGSYNLPHAETHTVVLPHVTALNAPAVPQAAAKLAAAIGADELPRGLFDLFASAGLPASLRELGLTEEQARATADTMTLPDNPMALDRQTLRTVLARAWAGERPEPVR
jgi:maleylacetate reductase